MNTYMKFEKRVVNVLMPEASMIGVISYRLRCTYRNGTGSHAGPKSNL